MADEDLTGPRECEKSGEFKAGGVFFRGFNNYKGLLWEEIFYVFEEIHILAKESSLVSHFIEFLKRKGLGPMEAFDTAAIVDYPKYAKLHYNLKPFVENMLAQFTSNWGDVPTRYTSGSKYTPIVKERWGRVGIEMAAEEEWKPAIQIGLMYNGYDHGVKEDIMANGIMLMLRLEADPKNTRKMPDSIKKIKDSLDKIRAPIKYTKGDTNNKHTILLVMKPLSEVLKGKAKADEQIKTAVNEVRDWIAALFNGTGLDDALKSELL